MPIRSICSWTSCSFLCMACLLAGSLVHSQEAGLTIDQVIKPIEIVGVSPSAPAWSPDSSRLAFLWNDSAKPGREIWTVSRDGSGLQKLPQAPGATAGVSQFAWSANGESLIYIRANDIYRVDAKSGNSERLTKTSSRKTNLNVSPDGRYVSYLQEGDLWLLNLDRGTLTQATTVGVPSISSVPLGTYNRPDVEVGPYVWGGPTYQWSPDSRKVALHYVDRRKMRVVPFPYYLGDETTMNRLRRGYPGDANSLRTVALLDVASSELKVLDLPDATETRIVDFTWSEGGRLLIDRESDTATDRWLHSVDPTDAELEEIWHDQRESRVYTSIGSAWHPDGNRVVMLSDLGDRYGLYLLDPANGKPTLLSDEKFDVTSPPKVNAKSGSIFFQSNDPNPYERHIFCVSDEGSSPKRISRMAGYHQAFPSPDGSVVATLSSNDSNPTELYLIETEGKSNERRITNSVPKAFNKRRWARPKYVTFNSRIDDKMLHARILEPSDLDKSKQYPVIFGPMYSNTVRNRWSARNGLLNQLLVERGYIVVQVDVRGSTGYGREFREQFLMNFGGKDIEDIHSAVEYMAQLPWVDSSRLGIWGSSYGGTLTIYSLFKKPGLFKAGVACAAAVDPYFFGTDDVAIVRRPKSHPDAFTRGAAQFAGNLKDRLLIIHGTQDDVVPFKTTVALAEELMKLGKDFDFAFAPGATHRWTQKPHHARYLLGKLVSHFDRYLGAGTHDR